jgi:hypothetical protein
VTARRTAINGHLQKAALRARPSLRNFAVPLQFLFSPPRETCPQPGKRLAFFISATGVN